MIVTATATPASAALHHRKLANIFAAKANYWAGVDEVANPWWLANSRLYMDYMCRHESERSRILLAYLNRRKAREG